jgi:hypothetical protein
MVLDSQLFHILVFRSNESVCVRTPQRWPIQSQLFDGTVDTLALLYIEGAVPLDELVADLDFPSHGESIPFKGYAFKGIG